MFPNVQYFLQWLFHLTNTTVNNKVKIDVALRIKLIFLVIFPLATSCLWPWPLLLLAPIWTTRRVYLRTELLVLVLQSCEWALFCFLSIYVMLYRVMLCYTTFCYVVSYQITLSFVMLCHVTSCLKNLCYVIFCVM